MGESQWMGALKKTPKRYNAVGKTYNTRKSDYEEAVSTGMRAVAEIKKQHERDAALRIAYVDGRVKKLHSLIRKAVIDDIDAAKVFDVIRDIAAIRVVVNNLKDIDPLVEALKSHPAIEKLERKDHVTEDGYRATHLDAVCSLHKDGELRRVPLEIQVRTLLQDAWAVLSHHDFYKNVGTLPGLAKRVSKHMSRALNAVDYLADDLREEIKRVVEPPNDLSDDAPLNREGIAFLYYAVFGEKPQEYEVGYLREHAERHGVSTVGQAKAALIEDVLKRLAEIHQRCFWMEISPAEAFEYGLLYAVKGEDAYADYETHVEMEWADVEATARREMLAEMPDTYDELLKLLEHGDFPMDALTELGAVKDCMRCGNQYLDADAAVEAISEFYGIEDEDGKLLPLLWNNPDDGSHDYSGYCSYCGYQMGKDD